VIAPTTGNVPLTVSRVRYNPASPDVRLFADEARTVALDPAAFAPVLCPAGAMAQGCSHEGEATVHVDYRARGSHCCYAGVEECVALAPGGDCSRADDADEGLLTVMSTDRLFDLVTVVARGRSRIPVIRVGDFNGELYQGGEVRLSAENIGEAPLEVRRIDLFDPAAPSTCGPDGTGAGSEACSCEGEPTLLCTLVTRVTLPPLALGPGERTDVFLRFEDPNRGRQEIDVHWSSTDPIQPRVLSHVIVNGLGIRD
jgi:hypothetical protein